MCTMMPDCSTCRTSPGANADTCVGMVQTDSSDHLSAYTFPELEIIMDEERLEGKTPPVSEECRPAVDVAALEVCGV